MKERMPEEQKESQVEKENGEGQIEEEPTPEMSPEDFQEMLSQIPVLKEMLSAYRIFLLVLEKNPDADSEKIIASLGKEFSLKVKKELIPDLEVILKSPKKIEILKTPRISARGFSILRFSYFFE